MKVKKTNLRKQILFIITILIILAVASLLVYTIFIKETHDEYSKKMDVYDYSKLYNNHKAAPKQKLTKIEALKIIIAASTNTTDIKSLIITDNYDNEKELWLKVAYDNKIITENEVNIYNCDEKAKYIDIINYLYIAQKNIIGVDTVDNVNILYTDFKNYKDNDMTSIKSLVSNNILQNNNNTLKGKSNAKKGQLNELIIKYVTKHKTISLSKYDDTVTEKSKLPSNSNDYPYILDSVDKKVYEEAFINKREEYFQTPSEYYKKKSPYYKSLKENCEKYYDNMLNIDYNTINTDTFINNISKIIIDPSRTDRIDDYIKYVKDNKISIKGTATTQMPIIYMDGMFCRIRVKLEFDILSADKTENILYLDNYNGYNINYDKDKYVIYIDAELSATAFGGGNVIDEYPIYDLLIPMSQGDLVNKEG